MKEFQLGQGNNQRDTLEAAVRSAYSGLELGSGAAESALKASEGMADRELEEVKHQRSLGAQLEGEKYRADVQAESDMMREMMATQRMREKAEYDQSETLSKNLGIQYKAQSDERMKAAELADAAAGRGEKARAEADAAAEKAKGEDDAVIKEFEVATLYAISRLTSYAPGSPEYVHAAKMIEEAQKLMEQADTPEKRKAVLKGVTSTFLNTFANATVGRDAPVEVEEPTDTGKTSAAPSGELPFTGTP